MKIASKQPCKLKSNSPKFNYKWKEADEPIEVKEEHTEKVLRNPNFYESNKEVKKEVKSTKKTNISKGRQVYKEKSLKEGDKQ